MIFERVFVAVGNRLDGKNEMSPTEKAWELIGDLSIVRDEEKKDVWSFLDNLNEQGVVDLIGELEEMKKLWSEVVVGGLEIAQKKKNDALKTYNLKVKEIRQRIGLIENDG